MTRQTFDVEAVFLAGQRQHRGLALDVQGLQKRAEMRVVAKRLDERIAAFAVGEAGGGQPLAIVPRVADADFFGTPSISGMRPRR